MKLRDYFDRVHIISLPERTDRRKLVVKELARIGLPLEPGKVELFDGIRPSDPGGFEKIGIRGCYMSHLTLLRKAREDGLKNVLICEDDLIIYKNFPQEEEAVVAQIQQFPNWGFCYLGHIQPELANGPGPVKVIDHQGLLWCTHMIGINGPLIDPLVKELEARLERPATHPLGGPAHLDKVYTDYRAQHPEIQTILATPAVGRQRSSRSDIFQNRWWDKVPVLREIAAPTRQLYTWLRGARD